TNALSPFSSSLTGLALNDAAAESEARAAAQHAAALSGDTSGFGSRGMGIHGGVSETEAEMARQAAAAGTSGALSDAAMSGDFGGSGDGGGNGK
ncbi:MAG: hypothetical protein ACXACT_14415, partial [Candidatus Thorarchaeota archaeon]